MTTVNRKRDAKPANARDKASPVVCVEGKVALVQVKLQEAKWVLLAANQSA